MVDRGIIKMTNIDLIYDAEGHIKPYATQEVALQNKKPHEVKDKSRRGVKSNLFHHATNAKLHIRKKRLRAMLEIDILNGSD